MAYVSWEDFFQYKQFSKTSIVQTVQWVATDSGIRKKIVNFLLSSDLARYGQTMSVQKLARFSKTYIKIISTY